MTTPKGLEDKIDYRLMSNNSLLDLHGACRKACEHDAGLSDQEKEQVKRYGLLYGVDENEDWAKQVVLLESELTKRNIGFTLIDTIGRRR